MDEWSKDQKKKDGRKDEPKKPEKKPSKEPLVKKAKPPAPKKLAPREKAVVEEPLDEADDSATEEITAKPKQESVLKAMGLNTYNLACPSCKFKRQLKVPGELKQYQLLCKKCGGQMKVLK
nr:hypothetical protein [Candidatus Sigynarchaeota archaeon]